MGEWKRAWVWAGENPPTTEPPPVEPPVDPPPVEPPTEPADHFEECSTDPRCIDANALQTEEDILRWAYVPDRILEVWAPDDDLDGARAVFGVGGHPTFSLSGEHQFRWLLPESAPSTCDGFSFQFELRFGSQFLDSSKAGSWNGNLKICRLDRNGDPQISMTYRRYGSMPGYCGILVIRTHHGSGDVRETDIASVNPLHPMRNYRGGGSDRNYSSGPNRLYYADLNQGRYSIANHMAGPDYPCLIPPDVWMRWTFHWDWSDKTDPRLSVYVSDENHPEQVFLQSEDLPGAGMCIMNDADPDRYGVNEMRIHWNSSGGGSGATASYPFWVRHGLCWQGADRIPPGTDIR